MDYGSKMFMSHDSPLEYLCRNIYSHFSMSPKRTEAFIVFQEFFSLAVITLAARFWGFYSLPLKDSPQLPQIIEQ